MMELTIRDMEQCIYWVEHENSILQEGNQQIQLQISDVNVTMEEDQDGKS